MSVLPNQFHGSTTFNSKIKSHISVGTNTIDFGTTGNLTTNY